MKNNNWQELHNSIIVSHNIKKTEYSLWKDIFTGFNLTSKSRLTKLIGPLEMHIDLKSDYDKLSYSPSVITIEISKVKLSNLFLQASNILDANKRPLSFVYYPFNEEKDIIEKLYKNMGFEAPLNQVDKVRTIKATYDQLFSFNDLTVDQLLDLIAKFRSPVVTSNQTIHELIIQFYAYLYVNNIGNASNILEKLEDSSDINDMLFIDSLKQDLNNRDQYLDYLNEYKFKHYKNIESVALLP